MLTRNRSGGAMSMTSPNRILRLGSVLEQTGLSRSTLYRKIQGGSFPAQVHISERCIGWRESDIEQWLSNPMYYSRLDVERDSLALD
jgi:prophage regulatory protein